MRLQQRGAQQRVAQRGGDVCNVARRDVGGERGGRVGEDGEDEGVVGARGRRVRRGGRGRRRPGVEAQDGVVESGRGAGVGKDEVPRALDAIRPVRGVQVVWVDGGHCARGGVGGKGGGAGGAGGVWVG